MADLESDIIGQVARLPLRPTEGNSLLPLHEAISNSLHAIHDRFGDKEYAEKGRIEIDVVRAEPKNGEQPPVIGFVVRDNGVGLNKENFRSFRTPFSQHKLKRGGKGVGRLGWLKVFQNIHVRSQYKAGTKLEVIEFDFLLRERNQIDLKEDAEPARGQTGTAIELKNFVEPFGSRCPVGTDTIVLRIIGHFLPIFAGDKSPVIILHDGVKIDIRAVFKSKIVELRREADRD